MTRNTENNNKDTRTLDPQNNLETTLKESIEPLCYWCHNLEDENEQFLQVEISKDKQKKKYYYCSKEHEQKIIRFYKYSNNFRLIYYLFIILVPISLLVSLAISGNLLFVFLIFISLGFGVIILPHLGEKTVNGLGLKKSLVLGRVLGLVLVVIGITLFIINGMKIFQP